MHEHNAHCGCGCGHDHDHDHHHHDHNHDHHHHHEHGEACGCGCGHEHIEVPPVEGLSGMQVDFLLALAQRQYLPVSSFGLRRAGEPDASALALAPVYIGAADESLDRIKTVGAELAALEDMGLITLDYDMGLSQYPYEEYKKSAAYADFEKTVREAAEHADFFFDTPELSLGSMALTEAGRDMVLTILE